MQNLKESIETKTITYNQALEVAVGQKLVELLNLKVNKTTGLINTSWGTKTVRGLGASTLRVVEEETETLKDYKEISK